MTRGRFAAVCRLDCPTRIYAVRVFLADLRERRERYEAISAHLKRSRTLALVRFEYYDSEILVDGCRYPLLLMEWVDGVAFSHHVAALCARRDRAALQTLLARWLGLLEALEEIGVAHGDLQHDNVLVTASGELRLVDYDGMFVPALAGRQSPELGLPNYQHPRRGPRDYGPWLDRFAGLVVTVGLAALIESPDRWRAYGHEDQFLFDSDDLRSPQASQLFSELSAAKSQIVREGAGLLGEACEGPIDAVPSPEAWRRRLPGLPAPLAPLPDAVVPVQMRDQVGPRIVAPADPGAVAGSSPRPVGPGGRFRPKTLRAGARLIAAAVMVLLLVGLTPYGIEMFSRILQAPESVRLDSTPSSLTGTPQMEAFPTHFTGYLGWDGNELEATSLVLEAVRPDGRGGFECAVEVASSNWLRRDRAAYDPASRTLRLARGAVLAVEAEGASRIKLQGRYLVRGAVTAVRNPGE